MVKLKEGHKNLSGFSLVEIIVSTVIILVSFVLFSLMVGKLYDSGSDVSELKILYNLNFTSSYEQEGIDTVKIKSDCSLCMLNTQVTLKDSVLVNTISISNKYNDKPFIIYHQLQDEPSIQAFFQ